MTEENNNTTQTNPEQAKSYSKEQYDGLRDNFVGQIGDLKTQLETLTKERDERVQADSQAETERLKEQENYKALLEKSQSEYQAKIDELTSNETALKSQFQSLQQDNALVTAGITDEIQILGLKAKFQSAENAPDFAEWLTAQDLATKDTGRSSGNAGNVSAKPNDSLEQRLQSSDPKVKTDALTEQLRASMGF